MAGTIVANTLNTDTGVFSTNNAYTGIAKAWVNFTCPSGTLTINNQFNVSSITRNASGDYTINFATAMANANYVPFMTTTSLSTSDARFNAGIVGAVATGATTKTTTQLRMFTSYNYSTSGFSDCAEINCGILGS
jgi:hypothetical protein